MKKYPHIITLPHRQSKTRPHMSELDRAAQFSPFAALSGHDEAIEETARLTDGRIALGEFEAEILDEKIRELENDPKRRIRVTYFLPDEKKQGGKYLTEVKNVRRIDDVSKIIFFEDRTQLFLKDIIDVEFL